MIDYIAAVFLFIGTYFIIKKKAWAWLISFVGQIGWLLYGVFEVSSIPLVAMEIVFSYMTLKGFNDWRKAEQPKVSA